MYRSRVWDRMAVSRLLPPPPPATLSLHDMWASSSCISIPSPLWPIVVYTAKIGNQTCGDSINCAVSKFGRVLIVWAGKCETWKAVAVLGWALPQCLLAINWDLLEQTHMHHNVHVWTDTEPETHTRCSRGYPTFKLVFTTHTAVYYNTSISFCDCTCLEASSSV